MKSIIAACLFVSISAFGQSPQVKVVSPEIQYLQQENIKRFGRRYFGDTEAKRKAELDNHEFDSKTPPSTAQR